MKLEYKYFVDSYLIIRSGILYPQILKIDEFSTVRHLKNNEKNSKY